MNLSEQLAFIRDGPKTQDAWAYILQLWEYGYGAGFYEGAAMYLPQYDDDDNLIGREEVYL